MPWPSQVNFAEMHGYPQSRWQLGEFTATRKVICDWSDRVQLLLDIGGSWEGLSYPYPEGPVDGAARSTAFAFSVTCAPLLAEQRQDDALTAAAGQSVAEYDKAVLTLLYSNRGIQWDHSLQRWYTERLTIYAENESVDNEQLHWVNEDGPTPGLTIPKTFYGWEYTLILHGLIVVPVSVLALVGCTNANAVAMANGLIFAPETLLFKPPELEHSAGSGTLDKWELRYKYLYKPTGWNKYWRAELLDYYPLYVASGAQYIQYPVVAFP